MDSSMKLVRTCCVMRDRSADSEQVTLGPSLPRPVQKLIGWGIAKFMSDPLFASVFGGLPCRSIASSG